MNLPLRPFWSRWQNVIRPITETPAYDRVKAQHDAERDAVAQAEAITFAAAITERRVWCKCGEWPAGPSGKCPSCADEEGRR